MEGNSAIQRLVSQARVSSGRCCALFINKVIFHLNNRWKPVKGLKPREDTIKVAVSYASLAIT